MFLRPALLLTLLAGCATVSPPKKISFEEAMGWSAAEGAQRQTAQPEKTRAAASKGMLPMARSIERFAAASKQLRHQSQRGSPMPTEHVTAWLTLLNELDATLSSADTKVAMLDVVRSRLNLETEIENDGALFSEVPPSLSERVHATHRALAFRQASMVAERRAKIPAVGLMWPLEAIAVTSGFGNRFHPIHNDYRFHSGIDLYAEQSAQVYAAESGVITFSGWNGGHGKQVEVQHEGHLATRYSHLSKILVEDGQAVQRGDLIGLAGATGAATGPHLHFEIRRDGIALDPEAIMPAVGPTTLAGAMQ